MAFKVKEFSCNNPKCLDFEELVELLISTDEEAPRCLICDFPMIECLSATRGHVIGSRFPVKQ